MKTPEHHFPFQVGGKQIFIKPCQVKIILPPVNSVHGVSVCADSFKKKKMGEHFTTSPSGFSFHICYQPYQSCHGPQQRRGLKCTSGPNGLPKWAPAGVIRQRCYKTPHDVQLSPSMGCVATLKDHFFVVMEGIWTWEHPCTTHRSRIIPILRSLSFILYSSGAASRD